MLRYSAAACLGLALACSPLRADDAEPIKEKAPAPIVVDLTLKGKIHEDPSPVGLDGSPVGENLRSVIEKLAKAKADKDVKGLVLRVRNLSIGWAKVNELRRAIVDFRASGKKAYVLLEMAGNAEYAVATAADEIVMPESGWLMLKGVAAEVTFYKKLFDKVGVQAEAIQIGDFKGAGEPFTRTEMSPEFKQEITSVLTDTYALLAETIAKRQGIAQDEAVKLIDGGPYTPAAAKAAGLVNRVAYQDEVEAALAESLGVPAVKLDTKYGKKKTDPNEFSGLGGFMKMMQALTGEAARKPGSDKPKIAVIYASGMIQAGKSSSGGLMSGDSVMGSDTVIKNLREAEADKTVKAIVLRVDSPGGSALASDLMWREITRIEKPIVASMSDVAASGGYYISMGCDKIYAEPGTLTGSIGVISIKLSLGGLMERLGLTTDTVTVGKNGLLNSVVKPYTDDEKAALRRLSDDVYKQFVGKAAKGRKMEFDQLEKLAGGRVYTGRQAQKAGLVDELGTLDDAVNAAKDLASLGREVDSELLILPKPKGIFESFFEPLEGREALALPPDSVALGAALPGPAREILAKLARIAHLVADEPVILLSPFELRIR